MDSCERMYYLFLCTSHKFLGAISAGPESRVCAADERKWLVEPGVSESIHFPVEGFVKVPMQIDPLDASDSRSAPREARTKFTDSVGGCAAPSLGKTYSCIFVEVRDRW